MKIKMFVTGAMVMCLAACGTTPPTPPQVVRETRYVDPPPIERCERLTVKLCAPRKNKDLLACQLRTQRLLDVCAGRVDAYEDWRVKREWGRKPSPQQPLPAAR